MSRTILLCPCIDPKTANATLFLLLLLLLLLLLPGETSVCLLVVRAGSVARVAKARVRP